MSRWMMVKTRRDRISYERIRNKAGLLKASKNGAGKVVILVGTGEEYWSGNKYGITENLIKKHLQNKTLWTEKCGSREVETAMPQKERAKEEDLQKLQV